MTDTSTPLAGIGGTLRLMARLLRVTMRCLREEVESDRELVEHLRFERAQELERLRAENARLRLKLRRLGSPPGMV